MRYVSAADAVPGDTVRHSVFGKGTVQSDPLNLKNEATIVCHFQSWSHKRVRYDEVELLHAVERPEGTRIQIAPLMVYPECPRPFKHHAPAVQARIPQVYDWAKLERGFKHELNLLPPTKQLQTRTYVRALQERIETLEAMLAEVTAEAEDSAVKYEADEL